MADIWKNLGVKIAAQEGDWLYRVGAEVRGPVAKSVIIQKLLAGEITISTPVARDGMEFHPLVQVAAFSEHIEDVQNELKRRRSHYLKRILLIGILPCVILLAGAGWKIYAGMQAKQAQIAAEARRKAESDAQKKAEIAALPQMGLVALVSLGSKEDVRMQKVEPSSRSAARKKVAAGAPSQTAQERAATQNNQTDTGAVTDEEIVAGCKLSQEDIFETLRLHLGKINFCVEDEKARDKEGLLPSTLELEFVVKPNGRIVDFRINERHFRIGPLNNCLTKAFNTISFPESSGTNCPAIIPIKIGK